MTLGELLGQLTKRDEQRDLSTIAGLSWLDQGKVVRTTERPFERNLDRFPFPAWDLVDIPRYQKIWYEHHGYYSMNMVTTRGCPIVVIGVPSRSMGGVTTVAARRMW